MKYSIYSIVFALTLACSSPKTGADGELPSLKITMDTVVIDPGQELLFLNDRLRLSALSEDKKYLFNFNPKESTIEQINLNSLKFEKKYPFEKEGPNGIGEYIMAFSLINDDLLFFSTYHNENIFNWLGEKLEGFNITKIGKELEQLDDGDRTENTIAISPEGNKIAFLISNRENKTILLGIMDRENKTLIKKAIPGIEKAKNFEIFLNDGNTRMMLTTQRYLTIEGGKVILGTGISSELYVLNEITDSLRHITFNSRLTANEKSETYPAEVGDRLQFEGYLRKIQEEITYMEPVWDEKKKVYYRFSYLMKYDDNAELKEGQLFTQPSDAEVYLSVLNKDLNLIAEGKVPELNGYPSFHFAKDGKLWLFENIEDEMGFVRLDINW